MKSKFKKAAKLIEKGLSQNYVSHKLRLNRSTLQSYLIKENIKPGPYRQLRTRVTLLHRQGLAVPCIATQTGLDYEYIEYIIQSTRKGSTSLIRYKDYTGDSREDVYFRGKLPELDEQDKRELSEIRQRILGAKLYDNADYHMTEAHDDTV